MPNINDVYAATAAMIAIAEDPAHGYNRDARYGPDYDCSSLTAKCFHDAGFTQIPYTATSQSFPKYCERAGFTNVASLVNLHNGSGLAYGDILITVTKHHVAVVSGVNPVTLVEAVHDERGPGHSRGGQPGDQTGDEIRPYKSFYDWDWEYVARWTDGQGGGWHDDPVPPTPVDPGNTFVVKLPTLRRGNKYGIIGISQCILKYIYNISIGSSGIDNIFGKDTEKAVKTFQKKNGLTADGIIGPKTWKKLLEAEVWN